MLKWIPALTTVLVPLLFQARSYAAPEQLSVDQPPPDLMSLRDPFKRPPVPVLNEKPKSDLEKFESEQFKMLGVTTGPQRTKAMLMSPDGKTYFVSESVPIGTHHGFIRKITSRAVTVREKSYDALGKEELVDTVIPLISEKKDSQDTNRQ